MSRRGALLLGFQRPQDFLGCCLRYFFASPGSCSDARQVVNKKRKTVSEGKRVAALQGGLKCELILNGWTGSTSMSVFQSEGKTLEGKPRNKLSSFLVASA